jgi:hypothetical protein
MAELHPRKSRRESDEELVARIDKDPQLQGDLLHHLLTRASNIDAIINRILTDEEMTGITGSPLGATVANRQAFPDFDKNLLVVLRRIEMLIELVSCAPEADRNMVFHHVYFRGFAKIGQHLTMLAFGPLPPSVKDRIDCQGYVRCMCLDTDAGLAARAELFQMIRDWVTAPSSSKLIEKANEQPTLTPRVTVETVDVD